MAMQHLQEEAFIIAKTQATTEVHMLLNHYPKLKDQIQIKGSTNPQTTKILLPGPKENHHAMTILLPEVMHLRIVHPNHRDRITLPEAEAAMPEAVAIDLLHHHLQEEAAAHPEKVVDRPNNTTFIHY